MGFDHGQGFLLASPMPKSQLIQALQRRARQARRIPGPRRQRYRRRTVRLDIDRVPIEADA
jgi:hypothetical protein